MTHRIQASDGELIDLIYAAMLGESSWQTFLDRLSDNAPDGRTILFSHNMSQSDDFLAMASRFEGPELDAYASYFVNVNPWLEFCALRQVGLGIHSDEILPDDELSKTEFYNDYLKPNNIARSIGVTIDKAGHCPLIVSTVTSSADFEMNSAFSEQLTRIAPHLRRASRFYRNGPSRWSGFEIGASLFDAVDTGLIVLGEDRRIRTISNAGQRILEGGELSSMSPTGQFRFINEDAQSVMSAMLRRTYEGQKTVSLPLNGVKLTLLRVVRDQISFYFEGPTVVALMERSTNTPPASSLEQFVENHGLTFAEQRALLGLLDGKSVNQIASDSTLSRETIRSQLKSLFAKTGTHSQKELLRTALVRLKK